MNEALFFYFMKVAAGNRFMNFTNYLGPLDQRSGLFVGYYKRAIPAVTPDGEFQGPLEDKELRTIALASREIINEQSIICVFTETHLTFWNTTGYLRDMPPEEVQRFTSIPSEDLDQVLAYDDDWVNKRNQGVAPADIFGDYHWLPAQFLTKVPRYELLAPVDSLRVHRWLNSGTFRSLHSIKGNGLMGRLPWLSDEAIPPLSHQSIRSRTRETPYAKLVRRYLEGILDSSARLALSDQQLQELAALWVNPAQLETVGALLALDLGFTLEVGLGKGQDVVDIKASLGHLTGKAKQTKAASILDRLERLLRVSMPQAFRQRLTEHGVFWIQCKAQDLDEGGEATPNPDVVLTLMPGAAPNAEAAPGQLYLSRLMACVTEKPGDFQHLSRWQLVYMNQIRQGLC